MFYPLLPSPTPSLPRSHTPQDLIWICDDVVFRISVHKDSVLPAY